jgi:hypothetical protein
MKNMHIGLLLLEAASFICCATTHDEQVMDIARQMHAAGKKCQSSSSAEMKAIRIQFLNDNKDVTLAQLVAAIDVEIDDKDIISMLKELGGDICDEYADSVTSDRRRGKSAVAFWQGERTIDYAIKQGWLP